MMNTEELKDFLETKYLQYNQPDFIATDPISIPHLFSTKEDIEISAFLTATISWGQRITILKNARHLLSLMDNSPHDFILHFKEDELKPFEKFCHRTFNGHDAQFFLTSLQNIYRHHGGLEKVFEVLTSKGGIEVSTKRHRSLLKDVFSFGGVGEAIIHARKLSLRAQIILNGQKSTSAIRNKSQPPSASTCS